MTDVSRIPGFYVLLSQPRSGSTLAGERLDTHPLIACYGALLGETNTVWTAAPPSSRIGRLKTALSSDFNDLDYRHTHWRQIFAAIADMPTVHSAAVRKALREAHSEPDSYDIAALSASRRAVANFQEREVLSQKKWFGYKHMLPPIVSKSVVLENIAADSSVRALMLHRANRLASYSSELIVRATGQAHAKSKVELTKVRFDEVEFDAHWRARQRRDDYWKAKFEQPEGRLCMLEYNQLRGSAGIDPFVRHLGEEPFHVERDRLTKRNPDDVVSRFENPDAVLAYLDGIGKPEWREERAVMREQSPA